MKTDEINALIEGCENALEGAGGFKWRAIKLIAALREALSTLAVSDDARRYAQKVGSDLVQEKRALQAQLAESQHAVANMKQWGLDRVAEKNAEIDGYIRQVRVLTESIAMTKTDWKELVKLRGLIREAASAPGKDWLEWQLKLGQSIEAVPCQHVWGTDGAHSNEFCKKCYANKDASKDEAGVRG